MQIIKSIQNRIYEIRGERVMLDFDLASLYEVETKALNQAVKRNIKRFPEDFMFQLTSAEFEEIRLQIGASNQGTSSQIVMTGGTNLKSQIVTSSWGGTRKLPYAFTEQGVAMLSGVLKSDKAINMNIAIMRTFVDVRKILLKQSNLNEQLTEIKERIGEHDVQLNELYDAMENLIDEKIAQLKWNDRQRIGFKIKE
ncbi:ORF6N domain-containing protein [Pedobacter sp. ISL-68]|uniref:ORF6N domain-containing protein n=1 Tax=unclassified Pedobacter TaxID=2628915 RepID=UPI001BE9CE00|nr:MULTISPECIES: ORF6N domain-containing protein [unclassified Pedobacter]MBT2563727.1 ORF6N domain-containing protein [Pedobacter sp. ISL-64]MBT2589619.1 ORF6N domain-containing protein [Pedobacter sp. ISL-68]